MCQNKTDRSEGGSEHDRQLSSSASVIKTASSFVVVLCILRKYMFHLNTDSEKALLGEKEMQHIHKLVIQKADNDWIHSSVWQEKKNI